MRVPPALPAVVLLVSLLSAQATSPGAVASIETKLQHIASNAALYRPDQTPTELTQAEINAYFAAGKVKLPAGVKSVVLRSQPDVITGTARIDFDQVRAGRSSYNPLLSIFSGEHDVDVVAHAHGAGGEGFVNVDTVTLDGVEIPRFALQIFVEKFVTPRYPNVGLDSRFPLPDRIDTAAVGLHKLTVTQK
jgi:hypothetical protein